MGHNASKFATDDPDLLKLLESVMGNRKAADLFWSCLLEDSVPPVSIEPNHSGRVEQHAKQEELGCILEDSLLEKLNDFCLGLGISRFAALLSAFAVLIERYADVPAFWVQHNYGLTGTTHRVLKYPVTRVELTSGDSSLSFIDLCLAQHELIQKSSYHLCIPSLPEGDDGPIDASIGVFLLDSSTCHTRESISAALERSQLALLIELVDERNILLRLQFNANILSVARAQDFFDQLLFTLTSCLCHTDADDVRHLPTVPQSQQQALLDQSVFNLPYEPEIDFPELDFTLIELIRQQAERTPDAIALRQFYPSYEQRTYSELIAEMDAIAAALRSQFDFSVPNSRIGVLLNRGLHQVLAVMAVLAAGCAYVPMDPVNHPAERIEYILRDSGAVGLVTESSIPVALSFQSKFPTFLLDRESSNTPSGSLPRSAVSASPSDITYVIYTSGSTGKPKGVLVPTRGIVNDILCVFRHFMAADPDIIQNTLFSTNICFDAHVDELFLPLVFGGSITCLSETIVETELRPDWGLTFVQATPSVLQVVVLPASVRCVLIGGETVTKACLAKVMKPGRLILNGYGPTETTNESSLHRVTGIDDVKSIGKPIWNTRFFLVDKAGKNLVPKHAFGELYIGGLGVTEGYCNLPELTKKAFVRFAGRAVYKTGDIVRINEDGDLEFKGRKDACGQIKLRGYRIELGEIQFALLTCNSGVQEAHVCVTEVNGQEQIVAYVAPASVDTATLSYGQLPEYMKPSHVVKLRAFPRTISGKLAVKDLPSPDVGANTVSGEDVAEGPKDSIALVISAMQETLLMASGSGLQGESNFFSIGGNSLSAVTLRAKLADGFGLPTEAVKLQLLLQLQTADRMATYMDELLGRNGSSRARALDPILVQLSEGVVPFFCIHAAGGQVHTYSSLAASLSRDGSVGFCGIQDPSLSLGPAHRLNSFEALGALYANRINAHYPEGPVFIGGHSSGGSIAFETARSLELDFNRSIGSVFLIDSDCPEPESSGAGDQSVKLIERIDEIRHYMYNGWKEGLMHDYIQAMTTVTEGSSGKAWQLVKAVLPRRQSASNRWASDLLDMISLLSHHLQIEKKYSPFKAEPVDFPIVLFRPELEAEPAGHPPGWAAASTRPLSVVNVAGANHYSVVRQPAVDLVAAVIRTAIQQRAQLAPIRE